MRRDDTLKLSRNERLAHMTRKRLVQSAGGFGWWLAACMLPLLAHGQTFQLLHSFQGRDGSNPWAPLVQGTNGSFYGTTYLGGDLSANAGTGSGTVFRMDPNGNITTVAIFDLTNGARPYGGLILGSDGSFYGVTKIGGTLGRGTVFRIRPDGTLTTVAQFDGSNGNPVGPLVQNPNGSFYGALYGSSVFTLSPDGQVTVLAQFSGGQNTGLILGGDGTLYGTTYGAPGGEGTVFSVSTNGALATLASLSGSYGQESGTLIFGHDGNLYGTTYGGGDYGFGRVFRATLTGELAAVASFDGSNGANPLAGLLQAPDGTFYGTTGSGGPHNQGTVFSLRPDGTLTTIWSFKGTDGASPEAALVQGTDGNLYGTTYSGGAYNRGVVFRIILPQPPVLSISTATNAIALSWATNQVGFTLQWSADLSPSGWNDLPATPEVDGTNYVVRVDASPTGQFFRLKRN